MDNIKIIADSTCDLSAELIEKYDIGILPLTITMGDKSVKDGNGVNQKEIYEWSNKTGETPKTAAPTIGEAIDVITPYIEAERDIIFFGISEVMSTTCNVMRLAAETLNYKKLVVVNSRNLSTGIGLQVIRAAEQVSRGCTVEEILADNRQINGKVKASFVVDTLTFLYRGGRCSSVTALIGNSLKLKPEIVVSDAKMQVRKKYRGNAKSVILKYAKEREKELLLANSARVFITHSGCPEKIVNKVKEYLESLNKFEEILVTQAGGVVSSHCGPNTLGVLYILN
ncbi:DegV family EDD domain-containing protein [Acetobacterium paludosum]|uniref:DegV family EDD domain-containing protein n=1 Tax=Acetobacterium paludosum TaxID=52693 RepID=A0A923HSL3_9FIRM|nr:DegV family protein [Acetobacterium paludosum]MBC3887581.1 DegV family EDD domain-containing protein [Acetobacterium paludosum]